MPDAPTIILASGSAVRARVLADAGIDAARIPSGVDEAVLKRRIEAVGPHDPEHGAGPAIATALAEAKARDVAAAHPDSLVIGADQVMTLGLETFDKPRDMAEARARLAEFRGKTHTLHAGVALVRGNQTLWRHYQAAHLTMRDFSDAFLDGYLEAAGEDILSSVGAYQLERLGSQLFARIEGDYFSILGLPLLPLMDELRRRGALPA